MKKIRILLFVSLAGALLACTDKPSAAITGGEGDTLSNASTSGESGAGKAVTDESSTGKASADETPAEPLVEEPSMEPPAEPPVEPSVAGGPPIDAPATGVSAQVQYEAYRSSFKDAKSDAAGAETPLSAAAPPAVEPPTDAAQPPGDADALPADAPPVDAPPADAPPVDAPPVDAPPVDAPPADAPPVDAPPADAPPVDAPPVDAPSVDAPPADAPSVDAPPADAPPVDAPPADAPPVDAPSVDAPPADAPPVDAPPVDAPPADAPPADKFPAMEPSVEESEVIQNEQVCQFKEDHMKARFRVLDSTVRIPTSMNSFSHIPEIILTEVEQESSWRNAWMPENTYEYFYPPEVIFIEEEKRLIDGMNGDQVLTVTYKYNKAEDYEELCSFASEEDCTVEVIYRGSIKEKDGNYQYEGVFYAQIYVNDKLLDFSDCSN